MLQSDTWSVYRYEQDNTWYLEDIGMVPKRKGHEMRGLGKQEQKLLKEHEDRISLKQGPENLRLQWECEVNGERLALKRGWHYKVLGGNLVERQSKKDSWKLVLPSDTDTRFIKTFTKEIESSAHPDKDEVHNAWSETDHVIEEALEGMSEDDTEQRENLSFQREVILKHANALLGIGDTKTPIQIENKSREEDPDLLQHVDNHHYEYAFNRWRLVHDEKESEGKVTEEAYIKAAQEDIDWVLENLVIQSDINGVSLDEEARLDTRDTRTGQTAALRQTNQEMDDGEFQERRKKYDEGKTEKDRVNKQYAEMSEIYFPLLFQKAKAWLPNCPFSLVRSTPLDDVDNKTDFLVIDQKHGDVVARIDANVRDQETGGATVALAELVVSGPKQEALDIINQTGNANFSNKGKDTFHLVGGLARDGDDEDGVFSFASYENLSVPAIGLSIDQKRLLGNIVNMRKSGENLDIQEKGAFLEIVNQLKSESNRVLRRKKRYQDESGGVGSVKERSRAIENDAAFVDRLERFGTFMRLAVNTASKKIDEEKEAKALGHHERSFQRYRTPEERQREGQRR
ncbi:MAG: hypothetical protein OYG31_02480 [Candidatus Kaiserbacteria bacterium]|nr:hypothetical protein [Candidatus Kaiserbacteria bacterium]